MKVSVVVVTYNHERFIDRALASVMSQETDFDFEVIVSEDDSTDATRRIVLRWQERHPTRLKTILSERNLRTNEVVARGLRAASGEYVALLDGDDHWSSPRKLKRQATFLDENPDCALCFHNAEVIDESGNAIEGRRWTRDDRRSRSGLEDIWFGNDIATCSVMFRKSALPEIPDWYADFFPITDWPLYILCAEHGAIGYIPEVMAAYRLHPGGLYSPLSSVQKLESTARFYRRMNERTGFRHDAIARRAHRRFFLDWAGAYLAEGEVDLARTCLGLSLGYGLPRRVGEVAETLKLGLASLWPLRRRAGHP
jgi:glycosyltransferase involved in cell wall biosynthesis